MNSGDPLPAQMSKLVVKGRLDGGRQEIAVVASCQYGRAFLLDSICDWRFPERDIARGAEKLEIRFNETISHSYAYHRGRNIVRGASQLA